MSVSTRVRRLFAVGVIAIVAAVGTATPASAGVAVSTTGAYLFCNTYNDAGGHGHADCQLRDTSSDGRSVYALMQVDGYATHRYNNTGGYNTTLSYTDRFGTDVFHWDYHYKVCRNVSLGSDNCSGWAHVYS